mgnify:CR=1 FL=1
MLTAVKRNTIGADVLEELLNGLRNQRPAELRAQLRERELVTDADKSEQIERLGNVFREEAAAVAAAASASVSSKADAKGERKSASKRARTRRNALNLSSKVLPQSLEFHAFSLLDTSALYEFSLASFDCWQFIAEYLKRATCISVPENPLACTLLPLQRCVAIRELRIADHVPYHGELLQALLRRNPSLQLLHTRDTLHTAAVRALAANCSQLRGLRFHKPAEDDADDDFEETLAELARACGKLHTLCCAAR